MTGYYRTGALLLALAAAAASFACFAFALHVDHPALGVAAAFGVALSATAAIREVEKPPKVHPNGGCGPADGGVRLGQPTKEIEMEFQPAAASGKITDDMFGDRFRVFAYRRVVLDLEVDLCDEETGEEYRDTTVASLSPDNARELAALLYRMAHAADKVAEATQARKNQQI